MAVEEEREMRWPVRGRGGGGEGERMRFRTKEKEARETMAEESKSLRTTKICLYRARGKKETSRRWGQRWRLRLRKMEKVATADMEVEKEVEMNVKSEK